MSGIEEPPRWIAVLDRFSVVACGIAWTAVILRVAPAFLGGGLSSGLALWLGLISGYLFADLVSGSIHWLADRYFDPRTPILGPALIAPFRAHHVDPLAMTRHDFFEISGNNSLATLPLALTLLVLPVRESFWMLYLIATVSSLGIAVIATNQFHCWAHLESPPRFARQLQQWGLILSPERHARHHSQAHDSAYCVTSGWLNPFLDRHRAFARLEAVIEALTGRPRRAT